VDRCIEPHGAGAVSKEIKAIAISRGYVAAGWIDLFCVPPAT
jgi:stage V sporulation protein SpoVS